MERIRTLIRRETMGRYIDVDKLLEDLQSGKCESDILMAVRQAIVDEILRLAEEGDTQCSDT